jgi:hypothetical protein
MGWSSSHASLGRIVKKPAPVPRTIVMALTAVAFMLTACASASQPLWVPDAGTLTPGQVDEIAANADLSRVGGVAIADAPDVRTDALVWLRQQGIDGDRAASLLTQGFPERTAAVPVVVEIAEVDRVRSLIAVEAIVGKDGKLSMKRLWLFEIASGRLIRSATFQ